MSELQQLIKMANQIADNFAFHDDAQERVADHLQRFWAPQLREKLAAHIADGASDVSELVVGAVAQGNQ